MSKLRGHMAETDVIANQRIILENQKQIKENQDIIRTNQEKLDIIIRNQELILALLKK